MPAPLRFIPAMKGYGLASMSRHVFGRTNQAVWMGCEYGIKSVSLPLSLSDRKSSHLTNGMAVFVDLK